MRISKRIIAILAACAAAASVMLLAGFADTGHEEPEFGGDYARVDDDEAYQRYIASLTGEQRQIIAAKEQMLAELLGASSN